MDFDGAGNPCNPSNEVFCTALFSAKVSGDLNCGLELQRESQVADCLWQKLDSVRDCEMRKKVG